MIVPFNSFESIKIGAPVISISKHPVYGIVTKIKKDRSNIMERSLIAVKCPDGITRHIKASCLALRTGETKWIPQRKKKY